MFYEKTLEFLGSNLQGKVWNIRISIISSIATIFQKISPFSLVPSRHVLEVLLEGLISCLEESKVSCLFNLVFYRS
jgi:hypothetical protein